MRRIIWTFDLFLSTIISEFHISAHNARYHYFSIRIFITFSDLFYIQFLSSELYVYPFKGRPIFFIPILHSSGFWPEEYRWKWRILVPLTKGIDENGRLTGIRKREREREREIHLARITFFGGIRLKPVKFIRTLHTGWIYTGPYAAGCGHNFEKRLGYADNSPRNVLDNSFPNGPKPNS